MTIKNFKTITIAKYSKPILHVTNGTIFSVPIFLQFVPTHFILRLASYCITSSQAPSATVLLLKTSLFNNNSILSLTRVGTVDSSNIHLDTKYKINPSVIGGDYQFTLCDVWGEPPDNFRFMQLALTIEFVEEI